MIRIFRHVACEGPGLLGRLLDARGMDQELVAIDEGQAVPDSLDGVDGLVFLGGPMSVNDELAWVGQELDLIRRAHGSGIPMLGFCLGSQLISKALGGTVSRGEAGQEIGWHPVSRVANAAAADWLGELPSTNLLFHWHGETFSLPAGAQRILSSAAYPNQGFVIGRTLALQCHIEVDAAMVREWSGLYTDDLAQGGTWNQLADVICNDLDNKVAGLRPVAEQLIDTWLEGID